MTEFYTNLRILSQDLYKHSQSKKADVAGGGVTTPARKHSSPRRMIGRQLSAQGRSSISLMSEQEGLVETPEKQKPAAARYFGAESMQERVKKYAQQGGIPAEFMDRYIKEGSFE
jgi:hypothetical protein